MRSAARETGSAASLGSNKRVRLAVIGAGSPPSTTGVRGMPRSSSAWRSSGLIRAITAATVSSGSSTRTRLPSSGGTSRSRSARAARKTVRRAPSDRRRSRRYRSRESGRSSKLGTHGHDDGHQDGEHEVEGQVRSNALGKIAMSIFMRDFSDHSPSMHHGQSHGWPEDESQLPLSHRTW